MDEFSVAFYEKSNVQFLIYSVFVLFVTIAFTLNSVEQKHFDWSIRFQFFLVFFVGRGLSLTFEHSTENYYFSVIWKFDFCIANCLHCSSVCRWPVTNEELYFGVKSKELSTHFAGRSELRRERDSKNKMRNEKIKKIEFLILSPNLVAFISLNEWINYCFSFSTSVFPFVSADVSSLELFSDQWNKTKKRKPRKGEKWQGRFL